MINVVNGFGVEAGKPLASSNRIAQDRIHRRDHDRPPHHAVRLAEPDPGHSGARRQEPQHLLRRRDGRTSTTSRTRPSRASRCSPSTRARCAPARRAASFRPTSTTSFLAQAAIRTKAVRQGDPLDTETMIGAQASNDQLEKILSYIEIGKGEGAKVLTGGERAELGGDLTGGYYVNPTIFTGHNCDADLPGGDLRAGRRGDLVHRLRRRDRRSPTTRSTASAPASGAATATPPTGRAATSRPAASGPTATTPTPHTPRSVATSSRASAARTTR